MEYTIDICEQCSCVSSISDATYLDILEIGDCCKKCAKFIAAFDYASRLRQTDAKKKRQDKRKLAFKDENRYFKCVGESTEHIKHSQVAKKMTLRWGVAGAGRISHDFVTAVQTYPVTDHTFLAVAARSQTNAKKFADDHGIPKAYEGYVKLAEDDEIDIVYVGNLNTQHFDTVEIMLEHGKHVLCEKPFTMNEKQTRRLFQIAKNKKLFLMEAVWSRFFPAYQEMKRLIDNGCIGDVLFASVHFGHALQHVDRLTFKELGGGAILDLGIYILQFQQWAFRGLKPVKVVANGHLNNCGTDESCGAVITYPNGKMAVVSTSARVKLPNEGIVVGTKGTLKVPDFWCPTKLVTPDEVKEYPLPQSKVPFLHQNSAGLCYQAEAARQCILAGQIECESMTHAESIELSMLMDLLRKELGVQFPEDFQEF